MIEMLVVVAIAGMLLSGTLVLFQQARAKSRDATREQHIKTIQNALALYANTRGSYTVYDGYLTGTDVVSTILRDNDSLPQTPRDPLSSGTYLYSYTSTDGSTYTLKYYLETNSIPGKAAGLNQASP
ncbi:MAG: type II secretion system protein [Candidatus Sungiibacteriota bacterium]